MFFLAKIVNNNANPPVEMMYVFWSHKISNILSVNGIIIDIISENDSTCRHAIESQKPLLQSISKNPNPKNINWYLIKSCFINCLKAEKSLFNKKNLYIKEKNIIAISVNAVIWDELPAQSAITYKNIIDTITVKKDDNDDFEPNEDLRAALKEHENRGRD